MVKIPLTQQIASVRREIDMRRKVYPGLISRSKMRQSEADLELWSMEAALRTLEWLERNREALRRAVETGAVEQPPL